MNLISKVRKALGSLHFYNFIFNNYFYLFFFSFKDAKSKLTSPKHKTYLPLIPITIITI